MFSAQDFALHCSLLRELQGVLVCQDGPFALGSLFVPFGDKSGALQEKSVQCAEIVQLQSRAVS